MPKQLKRIIKSPPKPRPIKQLELKRISDITKRGFRYILANPEERYDRWDVEGLLEAQLQDDQQVLDNVKQAIFDEIEKAFTDGTLFYPTKAMETWWLDLKKKWLK